MKLPKVIRAIRLFALMAALTSCRGLGSDSSGAASNPPAPTTGAASAPTVSSATGSVTASTASKPSVSAASVAQVENSSQNVDSGDPCLPFVMPGSDILFSSSKKVFAHYFYPFPQSIDNKPPATDYYNTQYLAPNGESNKWIRQGGYLRQRPLGVSPSTYANWELLNMEQEVRMAIARGITGFTFNVMSASEATNNTSELHLMLLAAQVVDPRFKIVVMPDISALGADSNSVVNIIASVASSPAAYKLNDGRLVVSAFDANLNSPAWWQSVITQLSSQGINIAFVPTFLGWSAFADAFASITYGMADWGTATPAVASSMQGDAGTVHNKYGQIYMMPVDPQQFRAKDFIYWEAGNSVAFRNAWTSSIAGNSDWVQLVTWSDFSESSEIQPYTDSSLRTDIGTGFYDLNAYYATWFLTGSQPSITHDVLYYFYRREPSYAAGPTQSQLENVMNGTAEDDIELLAFLTSPGTLKIQIGSQTYVQNAPAGITSFKVPLQAGTPVFTLTRNNADIFSFAGAVQIYGSAGLPSGVIDMTYWSGSGSLSGTCSL